MSKIWEVDPETRAKLLEIQKTHDNNRCVDCGAPSPQWISPKFAIFFCLACSGTHRSLGVHISFVRSATMDALKTGEVQRMALGGNTPWKEFFNAHASSRAIGREFEACTIAERYDSEAGEEWKERLTAKVEGVEYVKKAESGRRKEGRMAATGITPAPSGRSTPLSTTKSAPQRTASPGQKVANEAYFARMGNENASRSEQLAPSQGGKYAGFGSSVAGPNGTSSSNSAALPSGDEFQTDPVAALTKGFGWLSSTVSKQAASVNKTYIQPGMKSLQEGEFAAQARLTAVQLGSTAQQGVRGLGEQINKFVDPEHAQGSTGAAGAADGSGPGVKRTVPPEKKDFWDAFGQDPAGPPREKKEFWDGFAAAGEAASQQKAAKPTSIGTSAMKTGGSGSGEKKGEGEGWGEW